MPTSTPRAPPGSTAGTLFTAAAAAAWGTWSLFTRGSGLHPVWQSVLILAVIALATLPPAILDHRAASPRPRALWAWMAVLGLVDAGNYLLFFSAVDRGPVGVAVLTHYLAPVIVAALAPWFLREPLGRWTPPALAAALGGLALLVLGSGGLSGAALPAALLGGASAFFYGGNVLVSKKLLERFSGSEVLAWHCAVSAVLLALLALAPAGVPGSGGPFPPLAAFAGRPLAGALLLGVGSAQLFYLGLRRIPAQRAAVLSYLEPLVAASVGALVWGERLGAAGVAGGLLIAGGGLAVALQPGTTREGGG